MGRFLLEKIAPFLIAPLYYLLRLSWCIRESGPPQVLQDYVRAGKPCLYAHWHGDELVLIGYYSYRQLAVLSSLSKDGSLMALTLSLLGYRVFRGSSSKGGARGLINLIRAVKEEGHQAALAVDGPKGPIYVVKPGIVQLARKTGQPIVPVHSKAARAWFIPKAWNKCYVPKPFSRVEITYAAPIFIDAALPDTEFESKCREIKSALDSLQ